MFVLLIVNTYDTCILQFKNKGEIISVNRIIRGCGVGRISGMLNIWFGKMSVCRCDYL